MFLFFANRQNRKLDEMYDQLRSEYESVKRSAIQPANNFFSRGGDSDLFSSPANMMDNRDQMFSLRGQISVKAGQQVSQTYHIQDSSFYSFSHIFLHYVVTEIAYKI